jgi:hypothetical protein
MQKIKLPSIFALSKAFFFFAVSDLQVAATRPHKLFYSVLSRCAMPMFQVVLQQQQRTHVSASTYSNSVYASVPVSLGGESLLTV